MGDLLKGKIAAITGAGRGIGAAIAAKFAQNGAKVVITDIMMENLSNLAEELAKTGAQVKAIEMDVSKTKEIPAKVEEIRNVFGRIDIWVNNAGITQAAAIEDITEEEWDRMLNINLKSVFFCSQAVFKIMKQQNYGRIINMASMAGERGGRGSSANYSAAKAGVIVLSKCFALSGGEYNITANSICPGLILTQMAESMSWRHIDNHIPLVRFGAPDDVANAALFYASDLSGYVTGDTVDVNGGLFMR
ncbi:MAG: SDR family NAD(P)-dependent oxidoreductase [Christensenellales bacterium]